MTVTLNSKAGGWNKGSYADCTDGGKWTTCPIEHTTLDPALKTISMLNYQGAFRLPGGTFGTSEFGYALGTLAFNAARNSLFFAGHETQESIAEISIPALSTSEVLGDLNTATVLQDFVKVVGTGVGTNTPANVIDRVGGMECVGNELFLNGFNDYDGGGGMVDTTLLFRDSSDIANSTVDGYFQITDSARAAGYISPIPAERQADLGGTHLSGQSGLNIITRTSAGPSAYAWTPGDVGAATSGAIPAVQLAYYPTDRRLHNDAFNASKANAMWTFASRASYGLVVPGTKTVLNLGWSGGHLGGLGYKITQDEGYTCPGYCPFIAQDQSPFFWLYNTDDLKAVKDGSASYTPRPYSYGKITTPFTVGKDQKIGGGTYDEANGLMYISLLRADATTPVILVYKLDGV